LATAGSDEQGAYSDPHGNFLVPPAWSPRLMSVSPDDPAADRTEFPMASATEHVPCRVDKDHSTSVSGGLTFGRIPETVEPSPSRMAMSLLTLEAHTAIGLAFASDRLLADSRPAIAMLLEAGFRDESLAVLTRERLFGSGVGEFLGALASGNPALLTIDKVGGQAADTVTGTNVLAMARRCWGYERASWIANPELRDQLAVASVVGSEAGSAKYLYEFGGDDGRDRLAGRPIHYSEEMKKAGDLGDLGLVVWSEYLEGVRQAFGSVVSIHVRFAAGESCFRFTTRGDAAPWWLSPLTPHRRTGSYTLSPFVTLAERA
jgi:HK97 family phage major capsid protein